MSKNGTNEYIDFNVDEALLKGLIYKRWNNDEFYAKILQLFNTNRW